MKLKKEPVIVDATRWHKMSDHPAVKRESANWDDGECGLVDTPEGEQMVTSGDWVITDDKGNHYVNKVYAKTADYPYPLEFTGHYLIGGNPDDLEYGYWDTEQDAINAFAKEFAELAQEAQGKFLLVRTAPVCKRSAIFDSDEYKWRMIGRFSVAKLRENNNA